MGHFPAGTSMKNVIHYAQIMKAKRFQLYDYDQPEQNYMHYGSKMPPEVPLKKIQLSMVPMAIYAGKYDDNSDIVDSRWLKE